MESNESDHSAVEKLLLDELAEPISPGTPVIPQNLELIKNVRVRLEVILGGCEMTVDELFALGVDSVVRLDRDVSQPIDVLLDGKLVARGDLVVADDNFGIRITKIES